MRCSSRMPHFAAILLSLAAFLPRVNETHGQAAKSDKDLSVEAAAKRFDSGRKWAVLVGVDRYLDPGVRKLKYCGADAKLLAKRLIEGCGYDAEHVLVISDDEEKEHLRPFGINLRKQIALWLKNAQPGDTVLVFFSGHGFLDSTGQGYLAPKDCELDNLPLTGFRVDDLRNLLMNCKAGQKLLVLDCCHAGSEKGESQGATSQEIGAAFRSAEGLVTLASCRKQQKSMEWDAKGQGLFTYFLVEGLTGAADYDKNGIVDSDELYRFSVDRVPPTAQRELNVEQTPVRIIGEDVVGVFALARVSNSFDRPLVVNTPRMNRPTPSPPPPSPTPSVTPKPGDVLENSIGMKLVLIPAGEFEMGSPASEEGRSEVEGPVHSVRITKPFYLGMHEVTVAEFRKFVEATGFKTDAERGTAGYGGGKPGGYTYGADGKYGFVEGASWKNPGFAQTESHPVVLVSHNDAVAFCDWLSRKEGKTYRLPTEAEWEYACRAGTKTRYWHGDDAEGLAKVGNVADASAKRKFASWTDTIASDDGYVYTAPVGEYQANGFGLKDMHGNVWEWCSDWYGKEYYKESPAGDPKGPSSGEYRVFRGGGWNGGPRVVRSADRSRGAPVVRFSGGGFRVVRTQ